MYVVTVDVPTIAPRVVPIASAISGFSISGEVTVLVEESADLRDTDEGPGRIEEVDEEEREDDQREHERVVGDHPEAVDEAGGPAA